MVIKAKMRKGWLMALIAIFSFLMVFGIRAYADDVDAVIDVRVNNNSITTICNKANKSAGNATVLFYDAAKGTLTFSNKKYNGLKKAKKEAFMETALKSTKSSGLGKQQKNKVYNFIAEQDSAVSSALKYLSTDTSANLAEAKKWFEPFSNPISTFLGFVSILIFTFLSASIVFDIGYLVLPFFQMVLEHGEPHKKPFGVSVEAWKTNKEVSASDNGDNCMSLYLKKRIPVIILVSISLGYLISGRIYDVIVFFVDAFTFW